MDDTHKNDSTEPTDRTETTSAADVSQPRTEESSPPERPDASPPKEIGGSMENLMDMYEESFKRFQEGEVVTGRIISVDKEHVLVDVGYKSEGQISIREFTDEAGNVNAEAGDRVDVMVEWWDDEEEVVVLSKEKAATVKVWEEIRRAYETDGTVKGVISNRVKGGFSVDIGIQAFLPGSQADLRPIRNLDDTRTFLAI